MIYAIRVKILDTNQVELIFMAENWDDVTLNDHLLSASIDKFVHLKHCSVLIRHEVEYAEYIIVDDPKLSGEHMYFVNKAKQVNRDKLLDILL